jgi:hypothetical protein
LRTCFAPTTLGALLAAANYVAVGSGKPQLGLLLAQYAVAPGLGRTAAISAAKDATTAEAGSASIQIAGYRIISFSHSLTNVDLAVRTDDGTYAAGIVALRWYRGDWRLVVDPSSGQTANVAPIESLGGFTVWEAY